VFEASQPLPARVLTDWECGLFARSEPDVDTPDIMLHLSTMKFDLNPVARGYPTAENVFSIHPNVARARSQGSVRLRDTNPLSRPLIDPAYFTDPEGYDERLILRGVEIARELAEQGPLKEWIARELAPGLGTQDPVELATYARLTGNTVYHPSGSCKMGAETDGEAVLDPQLRVRGVERLRVADTSIFPSMTTVNPVLTAMMIGEKCAQLALESSAPRPTSDHESR
jgi:choline oxidase